jgi:hypothetical protein
MTKPSNLFALLIGIDSPARVREAWCPVRPCYQRLVTRLHATFERQTPT